MHSKTVTGRHVGGSGRVPCTTCLVSPHSLTLLLPVIYGINASDWLWSQRGKQLEKGYVATHKRHISYIKEDSSDGMCRSHAMAKFIL